MRKISKIFTGLALLGCASVAFAGTNTTPNTSYNVHQGVYAGAGFGVWLYGTAATADIGYQFNRNFALEVGGNYAKSLLYVDGDFNSSLYGINLVAKAILPLGNRFSLFAKAGPSLIIGRQTWRDIFSDNYHTRTMVKQSRNNPPKTPSQPLRAGFFYVNPDQSANWYRVLVCHTASKCHRQGIGTSAFFAGGSTLMITPQITLDADIGANSFLTSPGPDTVFESDLALRYHFR